ncbi:MAG: type II toxin-antitoxin system prevent-host-death family antitoxin [Acidobacteria bacterium]|nr:type II toxin-antitoxin system prevent-host-death family antitoxin [Acidobacteriota bacterium]
MKRAGIREARQSLSELIEMVRKGREVLITDRGKPVARLVPAETSSARAFPGRAAFRRSMPALSPPLSSTVCEDREDRL